MEETDYFYEKIGKALAEQNPHLDTATGEFVDAVRKEMVAQGIPPNRARGIILQDEDFISDVATSYGHYCSVDAHHPLPAEIDLGNTKELDEIAALAGLARMAVPAMASSLTDSKYMDEGMGVSINGQAVDVNSIEVDGVNDWDSPDFADAYITYATFADGTPLSDDELDQLTTEHGDLVNQAAHSSLQGRADFVDEVVAPPKAVPGKAPAAKATGMAPAKPGIPSTPTFNEEDMAEGNEFSGALAAAKAKGEKEFEVDGKRYTVKEDININITASGEQDALNLIRKLSGMDEVEAVRNVGPVMDAESAIAQGIVEPVEEERDIEYVNTPNEKIGPISAAIPNGTDLHRSKMQDPETANKAANPLARKEQRVEENLWKSYKSMIADVKAK
jgi:hypothetical protein